MRAVADTSAVDQVCEGIGFLLRSKASSASDPNSIVRRALVPIGCDVFEVMLLSPAGGDVRLPATLPLQNRIVRRRFAGGVLALGGVAFPGGVGVVLGLVWARALFLL